MEDETSLDPDDLEESSKTNIEDFICCICQLIPNPETALEEENCGHIFCDNCLNQWLKKSNECPFCKMNISKRVIKDKNKIVYRHLINLMVLCPEENCSWKGIWKDYSDHLKNSHNKLLKSSYSNINNISNGRYELYKYYKATVHIHPLKYLDTTMDNGWDCDGKNLPNKCLSGISGYPQTKNFKRFRCMQCDYDLCEKCMNYYYDNNYNIKNDDSNDRSLYLFGKNYYSQAHIHPLVFFDKNYDDGWACNGKDLINGCFSGITGFNQSAGLPRFRCEKCNFDLCENCMNHYKKKVFYEINQSYKTGIHLHGLVYLGKSSSDDWLCDGKRLKEGCFSGLTDFHQTKGVERFRCEKCDFDLCKNCMDYYQASKKGCVIF